MVRSVPSPLQEAPKSLNGVCVRFAVRIRFAVIDDGVIDAVGYGVVALVFIGDQQRA